MSSRFAEAYRVSQGGHVREYGQRLTALVKTLLERMQYRPGLAEGFPAKPDSTCNPRY